MSSPTKKSLVYHRLLRRIRELDSGLSDNKLAAECGYLGRITGRPNIRQFQDALNKANGEIEYDFGIMVELTSGINEFTGVPRLKEKYPQLMHLVASDAPASTRLLAYFKQENSRPKAIFFIVDGPMPYRDLLSDLDSFNDTGSVDNQFYKLSFMVSTENYHCTPKEASDDLIKALSMTDADLPILQEEAHPRLLMASLAGCLYSRISDHPMPEVDRFIPRNYGAIVAGYRPFQNNIWEYDKEGSPCIDAKIVKQLQQSKGVVSLRVSTAFPVSGGTIRIPRWEHIEEHLEEFWCCEDGLEINDRMDWHLLFKLREKGLLLANALCK
jgi:hypothetical protein